MPTVFGLRRIILLLILIHSLIARSQNNHCSIKPVQNVYWNSLTSNTGLSQNSVTSVIQDSKGFIWIGTYDGLNRFDGFSTKTWRHESNNANSLSDNRILCLHEDPLGNIVVGTDGGGLNIFDPVKDQVLHLSLSVKGKPEPVVNTICTDLRGNTWVGTNDGVEVVKKTNSRYVIQKLALPEKFKDNPVNKLICDKAGNIWIGSSNGIYLCRAASRNDKTLTIECLNEFTGMAIAALYQDNQHNLWIGTYGGLYTAGFIGDDSQNQLIIKNHYRQFFATENEPVDITDICKDLSGNFWISSHNKGLYKFEMAQGNTTEKLAHYQTSAPFSNIADDMIRTVYVDRSNTIWIGSYRQGLNFVNLSNKDFFSFGPLLSSQIGESGYKGKFITTISGNENKLWIGTYQEGLYKYDKCSGNLTNLYPKVSSDNIICAYSGRDKSVWIGGNKGLYTISENNEVKVVLGNEAVRSICEDAYGRIWAATWDAIRIYDKSGQIVKLFTTRNGLFSHSNFILYGDPSEKSVWIGTIGSGLNRIKYTDTSFQFSQYINDVSNLSSISNNHVWSIFRGRDNALWVGTDAGLNQCKSTNKDSLAFVHVQTPLLKDRKITAILQDQEDNLWLSSSQGLFKYNIDSGVTRQYSNKDGLQSNTFSEAAFKGSDGWMYFGGINGLNYFNPAAITANPFVPLTAIVSFSIFNNPIGAGQKMDGDVILDKDINATDEITLDHNHNNFLLTFAALHYAVPEDNRYKFKLAGYDKDWIVTGSDRRFAAYSNLEPGKYVFMLTSSNNDNMWSRQIKTITIIVKPAPWLTWWAKCLYAALAISIGYMIFSYFRSKHQFKNEMFLEKLEKEKISELNEIKLSFFTNITHELRTPLNLITGPVRELKSKMDSYDTFTQFRLNIIHRNASRLLDLINQVLDLRKVSSTSEALKVSRADLVKTIADIKNSFHWMAEEKQVDFEFTCPVFHNNSWFDVDKVQKIIFNLLSNAFKYTPSYGKVSVSLTVQSEDSPDAVAVLTIKDTGPGISKGDHQNIFDLFYRCENDKSQGTGIGLALCRKLTQMHHGSLTVDSDLGLGTSFVLTLPVTKQAYLPNEIGEDLSQLGHEKINPQKPGEPRIANKKTILIVEDNEDQRAYIKDCLSAEFNIREGRNGLEGFATAVSIKPDLIITDIMMPDMDGITLSQKLKANIGTQHIPIIVHSVKNSDTTMQQVFAAGADDLIVKPFDYQLLGRKINNMLDSRSKLLSKKHISDMMTPEVVDVPSEHETLVKNTALLIEEHMSDPEFSVERLARLSAMSRMSLHRKLLAITGKSASEFIREVRMKKAGQLFSDRSKRVNEVMTEVGISSNYHFNKYFREMYGLSPKEYKQKSFDDSGH